MKWSVVCSCLILCVSFLSPAPSFSLVSKSLDNDLDSDIVLRNRHTGAWRVFTVEGMSSISETALGVWANQSLNLQALADFDGDGDSDVLLRNTVDSGGWRLFTIEDGAVVNDSGPEVWMHLKRQFMAADDFDGDGDADVLLRDMETGAYRLFFFESGAVSSSATLGVYQNLGLKFVVAGDLDGDGDADILVRHYVSDKWHAFYLEAGAVVGTQEFNLWAGKDWVLQGVADYDGDGDGDILMRHRLEGLWKLFEVQSGQVVEAHDLNLWANLAWETQAADTDLDGDGDADVLLRHACSGAWRTFTLENFQVQGNGNPKVWANLNWEYQSDGQIKPIFSEEPGTLLWKTLVGPTYSAPVLGQDGTIYTVNNADTIVVTNRDGSPKWTFKTPYNQPTPVTLGDGCRIFVGYEKGAIRAYGPDKEEIWSFSTEGEVTQPTLGPDGNLYVGSLGNYLYVLDQDGNLLWSYLAAGRISKAPTISSNGTIYFGTDYPDWRFNALNPDGTLAWSSYEGSGRGTGSVPIIGPNSNIHVIANDRLKVYQPDGSLFWEFFPEGLGGATPVIAADGTIYLRGPTSKKIYALDQSGELKWTKNDRHYAQPTVSPSGYVYVGDTNTPSQLSVLYPDGSEAWILPLGNNDGQIRGRVAFGENNTVYAGTNGGRLLAISGESYFE